MNATVGANIRRIRIEQGLLMKDLVTRLNARGLTIEINGVSRRELGGGRITVDELAAISDALNVTIAELTGTSGYRCVECRDRPPRGFICKACGNEAQAPP